MASIIRYSAILRLSHLVPLRYTESSIVFLVIIVRDLNVEVVVNDTRRWAHPLSHHELLVLAMEVVGLSIVSKSSAYLNSGQCNLQSTYPLPSV
jgi:hypothetical protein